MLQLKRHNEPLSDHTNRLMMKAAWLHFKEELTQGQIAIRLGISRVKVNRLIQQAKTSGIVEIVIKAPIPTFNEIEEHLVKRFGLNDAIVVMDTEPGKPMYQALAQGTADWLINQISQDIDIGISLGRTLSYLPDAYFPHTDYRCNFIDIIGNIQEFNRYFGSYNVTARMAERFGGQALRLNAPTLVSSPQALQVIKNEPYVKDVLDRARNAQIILLSCGPVEQSMLLYMHNFISSSEMDELRARGSIGDVLTHFMDQNGNPIDTTIEERVVALTLEEIKKIPQRVLIAAGDEKIPIMRVALQKGFFSVLITNLQSATKVLSEG